MIHKRFSCLAGGLWLAKKHTNRINNLVAGVCTKVWMDVLAEISFVGHARDKWRTSIVFWRKTADHTLQVCRIQCQ